MTAELFVPVCPTCEQPLPWEGINLEHGHRGAPMPGDIAICGACGELLCATPESYRLATFEDVGTLRPELRSTLIGYARRCRV